MTTWTLQPVFREQARQIHRLVRGDGTGHAEHDVLVPIHLLIVIVILLIHPDGNGRVRLRLDYDYEPIKTPGAFARHCRIRSASTMASIRRRSSLIVVLMIK